jgi:UDP-N-acetylmuramoyl-tripeptide--D-alanyl-D-alanine ligase
VKLGEIARLCGAAHSLSEALAATEPARVIIDSREVRPGDLFVAVPGARSDGHRYVDQVFEKGAIAAVVVHHRLSFARELGSFGERLLFVENTITALQLLAARVLATWGRPVIGITGSAGKTTIKDLTAEVLSARGKVLKSLGNLNTTIGLPLTVTRMIAGGARPEEFDFAVLEMGMSSFGEIARLVDIASPDVGIVGNVGTAHIEFFGSQDAIARAKAELVEGIKPGGTAILNADDPRVLAMSTRRSDIRVVTFAVDGPATVSAHDIVEEDDLSGTRFRLFLPGDDAQVKLPLIGRHNVLNALGASAAGLNFGLTASEIAKSLSSAAPSRMRGEVLRFSNGVTVVDDSYNSNPQALREAVNAISRAQGFTRRIVVAGEMLELGEQSAALHRAAGRQMAQADIDFVVGIRGFARELVEAAHSAGIDALFCESTEEASRVVIEWARSGDVILIKGSRGVGTEAIVEQLRTEFGAKDAG